MLRKLPREPRISHLRKELSLANVVGLGVATIVGSGIFVVLGPITQTYAGSLSFLTFPLAAIPALLSALCYAEFGSRFSCAGQAYTYLYMSLGEIFGYIAGILTVFSYLVATSAVAKGFELYTLNAVWVAPALMISCTVLCLLGIKESARIASYFAAANCAFIVGIMFYGGFNYGSIQTLTEHFVWPDLTGLLKGAGLAYFTTLGWDLICVISSEMINPGRDVVFGLLGCLLLVTLLYSGLAVVLLTMIKPSEFDLNTPLSTAFEIHGDQQGALCVSIIAGFVCVSSVLSGILAPPRIMQRMAHDGLLFGIFEKTNNNGAPVYGTVVTGLAGCVLVLVLNFENLAKLTSAASLVIFTLVSIGLLKYRRNRLKTLPVFLLCFSGIGHGMGLVSVVWAGVFAIWSLWEWRQARQIEELHQSLLDLEKEQFYTCPWVPVIPLVSVIVNSYIFASLGVEVLSGTASLFGAGLILYFAYGRTHSVLNRITE